MSSSLIQTTMYSVSTNFFPDHKEAMVGYIEAATGIGLILGPLIGSTLYSIGGYHFIYNFFGSSFVLFSFFVKVIFDEEIDKLNAASISSNSARLSDDFSRVQPDTADVEMEGDDDDFKAEFDITGINVILKILTEIRLVEKLSKFKLGLSSCFNTQNSYLRVFQQLWATSFMDLWSQYSQLELVSSDFHKLKLEYSSFSCQYFIFQPVFMFKEFLTASRNEQF